MQARIRWNKYMNGATGKPLPSHSKGLSPNGAPSNVSNAALVIFQRISA